MFSGIRQIFMSSPFEFVRERLVPEAERSSHEKLSIKRLWP